jgi:hypothetical protein
MKVIAGAGERGPVLAAGIAIGGIAVLAISIPLKIPIFEASTFVGFLVLAAVAYRFLLQWHVLLAFTILVVFLIPIKRYLLPGNLPFDLEPYRLVAMFVIAGWVTSLLIDPRVRLRKSGYEAPVLLIAFAAVASALVNPGRVSGVQAEVIKGLMFLGTFFLVFYLIVSVVRKRAHVDVLLKALVVGAAVVGAFAVIESRTAYNVFDHFGDYVPFLRDGEVRTGEIDTRGGNIRAFGSAQSPIALGAVLMMMVPLGIYLARRTGQGFWWIAVALIAMGGLSTQTRTSVVTLIPLILVFLWLRPKETKRFWPALVPLVCVVYFALPGTIGTIHGAFFPAGGLVAEQSKNAGYQGSGRIADIDPALEEWEALPVLGQGYATRQVGRENRQDQILDNQWLKTLLETGIVGVFAWAWLFTRFIRRLGAEAKRDQSDRGLLLVAITAGVAGFAAGMFFYDAFSFIQVTFILFVLLGLGASVVRAPAVEPARAPRPLRARTVGLRPAESSTPG